MIGGGGELADRDVVRMAVGAVGRKGRDHLGADAAELADDFGLRFDGVGFVEVGVQVVQERDFLDAQLGCGSLELGFADRADDFRARALPGGSQAAALAARSSHQVGFDALGGVLGEGSAHAEALVVGVRQDGQESQGI